MYVFVWKWASLVAQTENNLPAMQKTWVQSLAWKDPLEKGMAIHSSVLAWRIPGMGEPSGLPSVGLHRVRHDWSNLAAAAAAGGTKVNIVKGIAKEMIDKIF